MSAEAKRRLIVHMSVSLDGFVARTDGVIDWLSPDDGHGPDHGDMRHRANLELLGQIGLIVLGRGAYEEMVRAWPGTPSPMGRLMDEIPKVVFSQRLEAVDWKNARLNDAPLEEEIPRLKSEAGGDIVAFGGGHFAHSLIRARLVDEYRLTVHPVALGAGLSLMHGLPEPQRFQLVSATVYADGSVSHVLRPA
jgi:dihydrofolate reductase